MRVRARAHTNTHTHTPSMEETELLGLAQPSLSHQAEPAGLGAWLSAAPAKPLTVLGGDVGSTHPHCNQPVCSLLCRSRQQPRPPAWQQVVVGTEGGAAPSSSIIRALPSSTLEPSISKNPVAHGYPLPCFHFLGGVGSCFILFHCG